MKYQYKVISTKQDGVPGSQYRGTFQNNLESGLNDLGHEGWKMCGILSDLIIFIRDKDAYDRIEEDYR